MVYETRARRSARALAGKALIVLVCVMLALTAANRALNELATPVVSAVNPQRGALEKRIDTTGQISAAQEAAVYAPAELPVGEVHVRSGQRVEAGDALFTLETGPLTDALQTAQNELKELRNNREKSAGSLTGAPDDSAVRAAEQALERAEQDLSAKTAEQRRAVELAQAELDQAQAEHDKAKAAYDQAMLSAYDDYLEEKKTALDTATRDLEDKSQAYQYAKADLSTYISDLYDDYQGYVEKAQARYDKALEDEQAKQAAYDAALGTDGESKAKSALKSAQSTLKSRKESLDYQIRRRDRLSEIRDFHTKTTDYQRAQEDFDTAQTEYADAIARTAEVQRKLDKTCESKKEALDSAKVSLDAKATALQTAELDRDKAVRDARRAVEDAGASLEGERRALRQTELDTANQDAAIETKEAEVYELEQAQKAGGTVYAPISGQITEFSVKVGAQASKTASALKIGLLDGGLLLRALVDEDEAGELVVGDEAEVSVNDAAYDCPVLSIAPSTETQGKFELCFQLPEGVGQPGMNADITCRKRTKNYEAIVPLSAVRQDDMGNFVYTIETLEGALGAETRARRVSVQVIEQDSTRAAVANGIDMRDKLISRADREISDGDRVRVE